MTKKTEHILVGISVGDLNGVGVEVILKTFEDNRILELCTPVIFASVKTISYVKKTLQIPGNFQGIDSFDQILPGKINVLNIWKDTVNIDFGKNDPLIGKFAIESFKAAVEALNTEKIDVLVTAPINKYNIQSDDFKFPGHTDYLNQTLQGDALMLMISGNLRVGLVTEHVPLHEVAQHLTAELLEKRIRLLNQSIIQDFGVTRPKIAVLGLNPHCGDNGVIGTEDDTIIKPTLRKLFDQKIAVFGPFSADSFFGSEAFEQYDAILAMYHDQGLIPFKTLSFGQGVNYTAGLHKIRTSPDHGTAYDIAGKNKADYQSFKEAVYAAIDIFNHRIDHEEITENPLKINTKRTRE